MSEEIKRVTITETDTIKANFAIMPIVDLSVSVLVQVLEPVNLVPEIYTFSAYNRVTETALLNSEAIHTALKEKLLTDWHANFKDTTAVLPEWIAKVSKVELIECNLLTPKE